MNSESGVCKVRMSAGVACCSTYLPKGHITASRVRERCYRNRQSVPARRSEGRVKAARLGAAAKIRNAPLSAPVQILAPFTEVRRMPRHRVLRHAHSVGPVWRGIRGGRVAGLDWERIHSARGGVLPLSQR